MQAARRVVVLSLLGMLPQLTAQTGWQPLRTLPAEASLVFDESRDCHVLVGDSIPGKERIVTFEWDHADWRDCTTAAAPLPLMTSRLVFDRARGHVLRFASGVVFQRRAETWTYRAGVWTELQPPTQPSLRQFFTMAYDPLRDRTVLFGGWGPNNQRLDDTWEFDGATWTRRVTAQTPPARYHSAMAYDEARQHIVMHGGYGDNSSRYADTWLLDGNGWTPAAPTTRPPAGGDGAMAWDRSGQQLVLFAGPIAQTWLWDGADWSRAATSESPTARPWATMATDPEGGVLLYGGNFLRTDLWRFQNGEWYEYHGNRELIEQSGYATMTYDSNRQRTVWIGDGLGTDYMMTWEHDGRYWRDVSPAQRPPRRNRSAAAFDPARGETIVFGGSLFSSIGDDTWAWNGTDWAQRTTGTPPPARLGHALAFEPSSQQVLLFGGTPGPNGSSPPIDDTWLFDGVRWHAVQPPVTPGARSFHALATDGLRQRVVLYGGFDGSQRLGETWQFANATWSRIATASDPGPRSDHVLAYDDRRDRVVLHGGDFGAAGGETWEFDGSSWSRLAVANLHRSRTEMCYDRAADRLLLKGGFTTFGENEVLELRRSPRSPARHYGSGCSLLGPPPEVLATSVPYFGNHAFQVEIHGRPAAITLLVLGLQSGNVPTQGCAMLVAPPFGLRAVTANAHGVAALHQQVPLVPELRGVHLYFQGAQFDGRVGAFAFSDGLDLTLDH